MFMSNKLREDNLYVIGICIFANRIKIRDYICVE